MPVFDSENEDKALDLVDFLENFHAKIPGPCSVSQTPCSDRRRPGTFSADGPLPLGHLPVLHVFW